MYFEIWGKGGTILCSWRRRGEARSAVLSDSYAMARMGWVDVRSVSKAPEHHGGFIRVKQVLQVIYDMLVKCYGMWWAYGGVEVDIRKYVPQLWSDQEEIYEFQRNLICKRENVRKLCYHTYSLLPGWMEYFYVNLVTRGFEAIFRIEWKSESSQIYRNFDIISILSITSAEI